MKKFLLTMVCAAATLMSSATSWTLDFSSEAVSSALPTKENATSTSTVYTVDGIGSITLRNAYYNSSSKALFLTGKSVADSVKGSITLPAMDFAATKVVVKTPTGSGISTNAQVTLYANEEVVSTIKLEATGTEFTFTLPDALQAAGTIYRLASAAGVSYNAQIAAVTVADADGTEGGETEPEPVTYPTASSLSAWLEAMPATNTQITDPVTVFYQSGANLYITDGSAFALVYGSLGKTYTNGNQLTGIAGLYKTYNDQPELIPVVDTFGDAADGEAVQPVVATSTYITADHISEYVTLKNGSIAADSTSTLIATDAAGSFVVYNKFKTAGIQDGTNYSEMTGIIGINKGTVQFYPVTIAVKYDAQGDGLDKTTAYTVADVKSGIITDSETKFWVKGYIVGAVNGQSLTSNAAFGPDSTYTVASNILIADAADETSTDNVIPVQLPTGDVRTALNLVDNAGNMGKEVWLYGNVTTYFSVVGLKSVTKYSWTDQAEVVTYPTVETLTDWIDEQPAAATQITGTVTAVYQNGKDLFITDGSNALLVYGSLDKTYSNGDQLTGIAGYYSVYNSMPEFIPVADTFADADAGTPVEPEVVNTTFFNGANVAKYVTLKGATITSVTEDATTTVTASDDNGSVRVYNRYSLEIPDTEAAQDITGFVYAYGTYMQFVPVAFAENPDASSLTEVSAAAERNAEIFDLMGRRVANAARGFYIIGGKKVLVK